MSLSANSLFHFTPKIEYLLSILQDGFNPRYCMENINFSYEEKFRGFAVSEVAIPMVCFCDIRLSQILGHANKYGSYAIGLSLNWGIEKGLNPILYEVPNSNIVKTVQESLTLAMRFIIGQYPQDSDEGKKLHDLGNKIMSIVRYMKPYKGKDWNGKAFDGEIIKFYNEREWRYIPDYYKLQENKLRHFLQKEEYLNENERKLHNEAIERNLKLQFTPNDIRYIIVEKENEIPQLINEIEKILKSYSSNDMKLLLTKIISIERLKDDF